jgi:hypothetical protein
LNELVNIGAALLALGGLALTVLSLIAWRRSRRGRHGFLAAGFACFAVAGAVTSIGLFSGAEPLALLGQQSLAAAAGLFMIYLASVKR